jgi:hypothetical protein
MQPFCCRTLAFSNAESHRNECLRVLETARAKVEEAEAAYAAASDARISIRNAAVAAGQSFPLAEDGLAASLEAVSAVRDAILDEEAASNACHAASNRMFEIAMQQCECD